MRAEHPAPVLGVTDQTPFIKQPGDATDPDGLRNLVRINAANGRAQLATREKLTLEFGGAAFSGRANALGEISRAEGLGPVITTDPDSGTTGETRPSGTWLGQAVVLEATDRSERLVLADLRGGVAAPPTGPGGFGSFGGCWHATDDDVGYFVTIASDTAHGDSGGKVIVGVSRFSLISNDITHQSYCVDADSYTQSGVNTTYSATPVAGALDLFSNQVCQWGGYLFVCAFRYVYCFRADTLTYVKRHLIDWTEEVQGICGATINGADYLFALSTGTTVTGGGRPVTVDGTGSERFGEFLGGVLAHSIAYSNATTKEPVAAGTAVLTRVALPQGTQSGDGAYEDHRFFRPSEWSVARPHGCLCYAFQVVVGTDLSVYAYIARTNQGFGYDGNSASMRPDGSAQFITACRANLTRAFQASPPRYINPAAATNYGLSVDVGGWEIDPGSLHRPFTWGANIFQNDIPAITAGLRDPQVVGNEPTYWALAVDASRDRVFLAGRRRLLSGPAPTVVCLRASDGTPLWETDTGGTVQQNAIAVDPTTGNLLVAMLRNIQWTNADGTPATTKAEVLELAGATGQTVGSFDLTDAVTFNTYVTSDAGFAVGAYGLAVNRRGQVLACLAPFRQDT